MLAVLVICSPCCLFGKYEYVAFQKDGSALNSKSGIKFKNNEEDKNRNQRKVD